jgi:hypothetical protein
VARLVAAHGRPCHGRGQPCTVTDRRQLNDRFNTVQLLGPCGRVARQTSRSERPVGGFAAASSIAHRMLDGAMTEPVLDGAWRQPIYGRRR